MANTIDFSETLAQVSAELKPPPGAKPAADVLIDPKSPMLKPHVDPYDAAKQIRKLARQLVDNTESQTVINCDNSRTYLKYAIQSQQDEDYWVKEVRTAAKTRRVSAIDSTLDALEDCRNLTKLRVGETYDYLPTASVAPNPQAKKTAEEIHKLAQSLPTIATAPVLPVDQVLRGIATLLKNAGYFDEKGSPVKP